MTKVNRPVSGEHRAVFGGAWHPVGRRAGWDLGTNADMLDGNVKLVRRVADICNEWPAEFATGGPKGIPGD
jgi:hypothetical protein